MGSRPSVEDVTTWCVTLLRRLLAFLHRSTESCGAVPLVGAVVLLVCARLVPTFLPVSAPALAAVPAGVDASDLALISTVLEKRAPELGLTLRQQVSVAVAEEAAYAGYDPLLILAIIDVESDFAEAAVSEKGARGLMQIKPSTLHFLAKKEGLRLSKDEVASDAALGVRLGIRYLRELQDRFAGNLDFALMAYNAGPHRIRLAIKEGPKSMEYFRRYPRLVKRDFRRFREGEGLGGDWALAHRDEVLPSPDVAP